MRRKIEWYQEVLALEPGSRIFFPLAKLFAESGQLEDAVVTLRQGLDRHPDTMEARLLLIQVLTRLERFDEAQEQLAHVVKPLEKYPAFWTMWARQNAEKDRDFAAFLMLVASHFSDRPLKWTDVIIEGLGSITDRLVSPAKAATGKARQPVAPAPAQSAPQPVAPPAVAPVAPVAPVAAPAATAEPKHVPPLAAADAACQDDSADAVYEGPAPEASSFRTRTMAELLASQGDFGGALGIYRDLWGKALDEGERADLSRRITALEEGLAQTPAQEPGQPEAKSEDPFGKHAKNRLMSTLEALAARLESRVQA